MIDYIVVLGSHTYSVHAYILARICTLCTRLSVCDVSIGSVIYGRRALTNSNGQTQGSAEETHGGVYGVCRLEGCSTALVVFWRSEGWEWL